MLAIPALLGVRVTGPYEGHSKPPLEVVVVTCNRCRNCCKMYHGSIPETDIENDSLYLEMDSMEFVEQYLDGRDTEGNYHTKHKPCDFLQNDGSCKLGECKPDACKKYPYTNQPERLLSLYSVLDVVSVCPIAFEIYERLKTEYGFKK